MMYSIYIVDDEQSLARGIACGLPATYNCSCFTNAESALEMMNDDVPDLVLLDIGLPGMNGLEALAAMKTRYPEMVVIMITAYEDIATVIQAMQMGAYDYVVKPIEMDGLEVTIRNALESIRLRKEVHNLQEQCLKENLPIFIGESKVIQDVMQYIKKVAQSPDTPILILGESGTGKELIASAIHYRSPHFQGPFIAVNCAAIPRDLLESELFGYEKGAFSGAHPSGKKGMIEQAAGGTLFLDEIGDLDLDAQAKLLRFLETGEYYKVGSSIKQCVLTRIVSATNKDLQRMLDEGTFRRDLYYRIGVVTLKAPSLNDHPEDILPIAKQFLVEFGNKFGKSFAGFSREAERSLTRIQWRGNVRELKNMVERAALVASEPLISLADLDIRNALPCEQCLSLTAQLRPELDHQGVDLSALLRSVEKTYINEALRLSDGNETRAAKLLGMKYSTLRYRRRKLDIP